jgi:hypothetical protein
MSREATLAVERDGRDKGGVFVIREKPAYQATEWFIRATQLLVRSGTDVPPDIFRHGPVGFVTIGIGAALTGLGRAPWAEVKPLLDELLACIASYQPPGAVAPLTQLAVVKNQIAEPATFLWLYEEVVSLHLGFSLRAKLLEFREMATAAQTSPGPTTSTSMELSEPSSVVS